MFARFDENPAMTLQDIKKTKRYRRTHTRTHRQRENSLPTTNKVCEGYKDIAKKPFFVLMEHIDKDDTTTENGEGGIMSRDMICPTMCYVRPAKAQISLRICTVLSKPLLVA